MPQIRKMLATETNAVLTLWNENCTEAANAPLSEPDAARVLTALAKYTTHPQAFCLVAEADGELVGFLTVHHTSHPILEGVAGEIEELYVQPQMRRRGIGSTLVQQAVSLLRQQDASPIRVHACAESLVARAFWQHIGWEQDLVVYAIYHI